MRRRFLSSLCSLTALALAGASPLAQAQAWPAKPILLIVPYAAGGPSDAIARMLAKRVGTQLGQPVIVDNRAGAGGTIGVAAMVKAAPDGYTFAFTGPGPLAGMPNLMKMPYAQTDYEYVTLAARVPSVIVVSQGSGISSLSDLVNKAKAAPGKLNYGSAGNGTTPHIGAELLKLEAGVDVTHVPYKGAAPAVTALLGGEVQLAMVDVTPVLQHVKAGKLKALAVAGASRAAQLPDVPTTKEAGLPGVQMDTNYGLIAPKGVAPDVLKKMREAVATALQSDEIKDQFAKQGAVAVGSPAQEYARLMAAEHDKWRSVVTRAKITLD
jgi:tripartite-type tricarboxylate transporter receptor subunit TctC